MTDQPSAAMPDDFDRQLGNLKGLPDVVETTPSVIRETTSLVGDARTFIVQTVRQLGVGDVIFVEYVGRQGTIRIALPPRVADAIARQRDTLTTKNRRKVARATAAARKARGEKPFTKKAAR